MTTTSTAKTAAAPKADKAAAPQVPLHPNLATALAAFQAEMPVVPKNHTARIPGKNGGPGYSYQYADLADVSEAAMPLLTKHGLAFVCIPKRTESGAYELAGTLLHASGETLEGVLPIAGRQAQEIGSSLTYHRRYLLGAMTGVVTDEDDDGAHAQAAQERLHADARPQGQARVMDQPSLSHAQYLLNQRLGHLPEPDQERVRSWWTNSGAPALKDLTDDQVNGIYVSLAQGDIRFEGVDYARLMETADQATDREAAQDPSEAR